MLILKNVKKVIVTSLRCPGIYLKIVMKTKETLE
jgi:hypothetical protein